MNLKVISIKYKDTLNKGISYIAKTNAEGVEIVNEGIGYPTYLNGLWKDIKPFHNLRERDLENLINDYKITPKENVVIIGELTIDY